MPKEIIPGQPTTRRYSEQEKDWAVRLVCRARSGGRGHEAVQRIAEQLGYGTETVRKWVKHADVDEGLTLRQSSVDAAKIKKIKELEGQDRELERANKILRKAFAYFAQAEFDRP